jgi:hypothetical protein
VHQRAGRSTLACRRAGSLNGDNNRDAKTDHPTERPISSFFKEPQGNCWIVFRLRDAGDGMSPSSPHRRQSHLSHARDDWIVRLILAATDTATIRRSGGPHQQRSVRNAGMNPRKFGIICVLLTATPGCLAVEVLEVRTINSRNRSSERRNVGSCRRSSSAISL